MFKRWENLSEILLPEVEDFCNTYNKREKILKEIEEFSQKEKVPILLPVSAALLRLIVSILKPKRVLEIGTGVGYSTLNIYYGYREAEITTVDSNRKRLKKAEEFFERAGAPIKTVLSDGMEYIRELLSREEIFDFIFVDSVKSEYPFFNYKVQPLLKERGVALFDNVLFRGYVAGRDYDKKYERGVKLLRRFLEDIKNYPNFEATLIPVGDGLLFLKQKELSYEKI